MKKLRILLTCLCISVLAIGCNMKEEGREGDDHGEITNRNAGGLNIGNSLGNPNLNLTKVNNNVPHVNKTGFRVLNEAEEYVENLHEVKSATIIARNHNAYAAVEMDDDFHGELSSFIEDQIANQVRDADASIQNVYISSNQDFFRQMNQYKGQIQNGRNREEMTSGFNQMVQRVFTNHAR
ncbi:YhcN/YlaJ family sporulation lipoprotein [Neobacillus niacini]|uniref:YhcN/YlaJ family sporulation lipoprotein n=1 Tax=Neobacillus niacini TaxID=86668 RepID=UPI0039837EA3